MDEHPKQLEAENENLKQKYCQLVKKHLRIEKRLDSIIKYSDKNNTKLLEELNDLKKNSHRFDLIIKHSDNQGRKILEEKDQVQEMLEKELAINEAYEKVVKEKSKMAAMGEMVENISHQFKQPLSSINTIVSTMKLKHEMGIVDEKEFNTYYKQLNDVVTHMNDTINGFKNFFEEDKTTHNFKIEYIIDKCIELIVSRIKHQNVIIKKDYIDAKYTGNKNEMIQVIMNLLINALDALKDIDEKRYIFIKIFKNEKNISISVKDNAGGILEENISSIFEARFSTKKAENGSGIGLYMSKKIIIEKFGGNIFVENTNYSFEDKLYKGAEFIINLPIN